MARKKKVNRKRAGGTPIGGGGRKRKAGGTRVGGGTAVGGGTRVGGGVRRKRRRKRAPKAGFLGEIGKHILIGMVLNKLGALGGHHTPASFP